MVDPSVATSTPPPARWWWRVTVAKNLRRCAARALGSGMIQTETRVVVEGAAKCVRQLGDIGLVPRTRVDRHRCQSFTSLVAFRSRVDFETDPEYQQKLDWVEEFMVNELEPLDPYDKKNPETMATLRPLQQQVRDHGLWAAHHASSASCSALGANCLHKAVPGSVFSAAPATSAIVLGRWV